MKTNMREKLLELEKKLDRGEIRYDFDRIRVKDLKNKKVLNEFLHHRILFAVIGGAYYEDICDVLIKYADNKNYVNFAQMEEILRVYNELLGVQKILNKYVDEK